MGDGKESQKKPGHGRILIVGDKRKKKKLASLFTLLTHIFFCIFYYFTKPNCWILPGYGYDPVSLLPVMCQFPFPLMILFFLLSLYPMCVPCCMSGLAIPRHDASTMEKRVTFLRERGKGGGGVWGSPFSAFSVRLEL